MHQYATNTIQIDNLLAQTTTEAKVVVDDMEEMQS
jgi:hypothetical protein